MQIYLPIAEIPVNILLLLALGTLGGLLAGMFGIGGGFIITPLLIFIGIPPSIAVATSANQIIASSLSGLLAHLHRRNVDIKMGVYLLGGGLVGSFIGVEIFAALKKIGQIDLAISLAYVFFLGTIASMMGWESGQVIWRKRRGEAVDDIVRPLAIIQRFRRLQLLSLPMKTYFPRSNLTISGILPIGVGVVAGILVSLMGIGGGFVMIPAMIYLLGMPTSVVIGTSLFQIVFTTSLVTLLHAVQTQTVDIVLAFLLIAGGVVGAQFGTTIGVRVAPEKLRAGLAAMVLLVCLRLVIELFLTPSSLYSVTVLEP